MLHPIKNNFTFYFFNRFISFQRKYGELSLSHCKRLLQTPSMHVLHVGLANDFFLEFIYFNNQNKSEIDQLI